MKTNRPILLLVLTALFMGVTGFSPTQGNVDYFKVRSMGDRILLEWKSLDEEGLIGYSLERRKENETGFDAIRNFEPLGSGSLYQFIDLGLYKTAAGNVDYRLKVVTRSGTTYLEGSGNYTTTSVRKTWGSIKAMFK
ncbi:MAG: hypothetical protein HUU10_03675 [Bacteroidetes bacterium]|nr:hypothetical protein [Bacteroidota bacterium]